MLPDIHSPTALFNLLKCVPLFKHILYHLFICLNLTCVLLVIPGTVQLEFRFQIVEAFNHLVVEDLNNISLSEAWYSERTKQLREKYFKNNIEGMLCYNCIYGKNSEY